MNEPIVPLILEPRPPTDSADLEAMDTKPRLQIDLMVRVDSGLFMVGRLHDPLDQVETFGLAPPDRPDGLIGLSPPHPALRWFRSLRPSPMALDSSDGQGFVAFLPVKLGSRVRLALHLRSGELSISEQAVLDLADLDKEALDRLWPHSGSLLLQLAERMLPANHPFSMRLRRHAGEMRFGPPVLCIDQALYVESGLLYLYGWSPFTQPRIRRLLLLGAKGWVNLTAELQRIARPDLAETFPELVGTDYGLLLLRVLLPDELPGASLWLETTGGEQTTVGLIPRAVAWPDCEPLLRSLWPQTLGDLPDLIEQCQGCGMTQLAARLAVLRAGMLVTQQGNLPTYIQEAVAPGFFAIDRAWALGAGLLLMGRRFDPYGQWTSVRVHAPAGQPVDITARLFAVPRPDVDEASCGPYPEIPPDTGFISWVPLPSEPEEIRLVELCRTKGTSQWLSLPNTQHRPTPLALVREILGLVPHPRRITRRLYDLFDQHLGPALSTLKPLPPSPERIEAFDFGTPPPNPWVSILVPLYGHIDCLRHQLAQFADDPDFQAADLLYLVDDPRLLDEALDLAATVAYPLFGVPFRVVYAGAKLGFAAIHNLGARLARADRLLLLHADVIPLHPGWLGILLDDLEQLPEAGAVAPLLLLPEGGMQHAGMTLNRRPGVPGFLFRHYPGKGHAWQGPDRPLERTMLAGSCLLLRTADYLECGGLDEGYWVGDYEDADLCLRLGQRGQRLYLEPRAQLCHLERQAPGLADWGDHRPLLSFYDAWRFGDKIRTGRLPALEPRGLTSCVS